MFIKDFLFLVAYVYYKTFADYMRFILQLNLRMLITAQSKVKDQQRPFAIMTTASAKIRRYRVNVLVLRRLVDTLVIRQTIRVSCFVYLVES